jgi:hypothetical protein
MDVLLEKFSCSTDVPKCTSGTFIASGEMDILFTKLFV